MSNEFSVNLNVNVNNPPFKETIIQSALFDQSNQGQDSAILSVPTSVTAVPFPDVSTYGFLFLQNLDSTNFVNYGTSGSNLCGQLNAGDFHWLRLKPGVNFAMQSNTSACQVYYKLYQK